jgi:hypothetical protein
MLHPILISAIVFLCIAAVLMASWMYLHFELQSLLSPPDDPEDVLPEPLTERPGFFVPNGSNGGTTSVKSNGTAIVTAVGGFGGTAGGYGTGGGGSTAVVSSATADNITLSASQTQFKFSLWGEDGQKGPFTFTISAGTYAFNTLLTSIVATMNTYDVPADAMAFTLSTASFPYGTINKDGGTAFKIHTVTNSAYTSYNSITGLITDHLELIASSSFDSWTTTFGFVGTVSSQISTGGAGGVGGAGGTGGAGHNGGDGGDGGGGGNASDGGSYVGIGGAGTSTSSGGRGGFGRVLYEGVNGDDGSEGAAGVSGNPGGSIYISGGTVGAIGSGGSATLNTIAFANGDVLNTFGKGGAGGAGGSGSAGANGIDGNYEHLYSANVAGTDATADSADGSSGGTGLHGCVIIEFDVNVVAVDNVNIVTNDNNIQSANRTRRIVF